MRWLLVFLSVLLPLSFSQADEYFALIENPSQLLGCWKRIIFPESVMKEMNSIEPFPLEHQWYCFLEDGELLVLHSNRDQDYSASRVIELVKVFPVVEEYSIPQAGIVLTHHKPAQQKTVWISSLITRNWTLAGVELKAGDVLMTIRNRETGEDVYFRFLRKIS